MPLYNGRMCEGVLREKGHLQTHCMLSKVTALPDHRSSTVQTADRGTSATVQCYSVCSTRGTEWEGYPGRKCELGRGEKTLTQSLFNYTSN